MPRQPTPALDAFVEALKPIAMQFNISTLVIAGVDPVTSAAHVYGSADSVNATREAAKEKFGFGEEISWNDV